MSSFAQSNPTVFNAEQDAHKPLDEVVKKIKKNRRNIKGKRTGSQIIKARAQTGLNKNLNRLRGQRPKAVLRRRLTSNLSSSSVKSPSYRLPMVTQPNIVLNVTAKKGDGSNKGISIPKSERKKLREQLNSIAASTNQLNINSIFNNDKNTLSTLPSTTIRAVQKRRLRRDRLGRGSSSSSTSTSTSLPLMVPPMMMIPPPTPYSTIPTPFPTAITTRPTRTTLPLPIPSTPITFPTSSPFLPPTTTPLLSPLPTTTTPLSLLPLTPQRRIPRSQRRLRRRR